ncbi:HpcH/HpaI aldolase/citrate lyase family protein [Ramlibacter sp. G-1-2-2]|uniref:HpcH/HpaI aldolase/citrate lyase family protein n=1 Tax=Ramlibacter agri TaxID=2728837 RepID=A0A848H115_9BURK|nr:HpcH/HpaI aldolase/citrate lyase family protein [Ramlibacter agri]NML44264.1 HpcH/HpaI aldolase/citrate lyase family protein [Ramlibacter agri]
MNAFLDQLSSGAAPSAGTFLMSASPLIAEAVGCCGFDWAIIDGEHSPIDTMDLAHMLQALGTTPTVPVVRMAWNDTVLVKRALDAGASTLLFPFVQDAEEAQRAVRATRYPPEGIRGMAGLSRASRFGAVPDHFKTANSRIGVVVQIETPAALDGLEEIASVPGVDALFIGPTDLSGSMGLHGNGAHPDVQRALQDFARRCNALGKPAGTLAASAEQARQYGEAGFRFVAIGSDLGLLTGNARGMLAKLREGAAKPSGSY